jgi:hypothetical protein
LDAMQAVGQLATFVAGASEFTVFPVEASL